MVGNKRGIPGEFLTMNKVIIALVLVSFVCGCGSIALNVKSQEDKKIPAIAKYSLSFKSRIAVMDFEGDSEGIISKWVITKLADTGKFSIIETVEIENAKKVLSLSKSDTGAIPVIKMGKVLNADLIILGDVLKDGNIVSKDTLIRVDLRVVNATSGKVVYANQSQGDKDSIMIGVDEMIDELNGKLPVVEGIVARRSEKTVLVSFEKPADISINQKAVVYRVRGILRDPDTGEDIGIDRMPVGEISVQDLREKVYTAEIIEEVGGHSIEIGDRVVTK